jgi:hypothetical protein
LLQGCSNVSTAAQLRRKMQHAEIRAELATNQPLLDSTHGTTIVPLIATLDVATPANHGTPVQYRLGVHHVRTGSLLEPLPVFVFCCSSSRVQLTSNVQPIGATMCPPPCIAAFAD